MADAKFIIASLNAMARATQSSIKILMGKIEYRQLRNQLVHNTGAEDSTDQLLQKVTDNIVNRHKCANLLAEQLQESCDAFLDYLLSFSSPLMDSDITLAERQVDLLMTAYNRDNDVIKDKVAVPSERLTEVISKLELMPEIENLRKLVISLRKWENAWNEVKVEVQD